MKSEFFKIYPREDYIWFGWYCEKCGIFYDEKDVCGEYENCPKCDSGLISIEEWEKQSRR